MTYRIISETELIAIIAAIIGDVSIQRMIGMSLLVFVFGVRTLQLSIDGRR